MDIEDIDNYTIPISTHSRYVKESKKSPATEPEKPFDSVDHEDNNYKGKLTLLPYYNSKLEEQRKNLPKLPLILKKCKSSEVSTSKPSKDVMVTSSGICVTVKGDKALVHWDQPYPDELKKHARLLKALGIPWEVPFIPIKNKWYHYMTRCSTSLSADVLRTVTRDQQMKIWMMMMENPYMRGVTVISSRDGELAKAMGGYLTYRSLLVNYSKAGLMYPVYKGYGDSIITEKIKPKPLLTLYGFGQDSDQALLDNVSYIANKYNRNHIILCCSSSNPLNFARKLGLTPQRAIKLVRPNNGVSV